MPNLNLKKRPMFIPVLFVFGILATLILFMCLPLGQDAGNAKEGHLNLSKADLDKSNWQLNGQWLYVPGLLLTPETFPTDGQKINVPTDWSDTIDGCATYRLTIQTDDTRQLVLFVPEIYTAYKLYINGELTRGAGTVSCNPKEGNPQFEAVLVPVKAADGEIDILIQASNYHFVRPHMNNLVLLGEHDKLSRWFFRTRALYTFGLGFMLAAAFYHLALFVLRRKDTIYLLFSLLCSAGFLRFSLDTNGISDMTGWFSLGKGVMDMRFYSVLFLFHALLICIFSLYVFERQWTVKHRWWIIGYPLIGAVLAIVVPMNNSRVLLAVAAVMLPPMLFTIYKAARSKTLREDRWMWLYFTALVLYTGAGGVSKYFFDHVLFMPGLVTNMYLIMAQSLILAKQYTDVREKEQKMAVENALLEETANMRSDLIANLSHEVRTPLTVMSTYAQMAIRQIQEGGKNEQTMADLSTIQSEAKRLADLTSDSLQISKSGQGPLDLESIARHSAGLLHRQMEQQGRTLTVDIPATLPLVWGNANDLTQLLWNLLENAIKHSGSGSVTISAAADDKFVSVTVSNEGDGIPPELLPRIFERGVSGSGSSGLGLSICREIARFHGGDITARSRQGEGAAFTLTLPVHENKEGEING